MGVWGQSPQWGPGAEPRWGVRVAKPPEAESFLVLERPMERQHLTRCQFLAVSIVWASQENENKMHTLSVVVNREGHSPLQSIIGSGEMS